MSVLNFYTILMISLIILISYVVYLRLQKPLEYRQLSSTMPSSTKSIWSEIQLTYMLGMTKSNEFLPIMAKLVQNIGPIVHSSIAGHAYVVLNDPNDIKILLSHTEHGYIHKGDEYNNLKPWLNDGLLLSTGTKWQNRRKLLTNCFHFKSLEMYTTSINKHSRILVQKLLEESAKYKEISIKEYIKLCSLDIICETMMGVEIRAQDGQSVEYVKAVNSACSSIIQRTLKFWLRNNIVFKLSKPGREFYKSIRVLHDFTKNFKGRFKCYGMNHICWLWNDTVFKLSKPGKDFYKSIRVLHDITKNVVILEKVIKNKQMLLNNSETEYSESKFNDKTKSKSFLDLLINCLKEYPDQMTNKDIQEEVDTFIFEGHDTSSNAIIITLVILAIHPDIQDKVRNELNDIFDDSDRDATMKDLNGMKYLEAVIKESLRLYPSVPIIGRKLQTTLHIQNYSIPSDVDIFVIPHILHRTEEIFNNAEEFIPERFLDDDNKSKFHFAYIPFSAGPRNCIGQKFAIILIKIVISTILRQTRIKTLGTKSDIRTSYELVLKIESIPKLKFIKI